MTESAGESPPPIIANGVDPSGAYLLPPIAPGDLPAFARGERHAQNEQNRWQRVKSSAAGEILGLPLNVNPLLLSQTGWGIVFGPEVAQAVKDALRPLVQRRRKQVDNGQLFKEELHYLPGESYREWLFRHGVSSGNIQLKKLPYYLLIVGDPASVPFAFTRDLQIEYAVGRLHFDAVDDYAAYVASVIAQETGQTPAPARKIAFFAPDHDQTTSASANYLVKPLALGDDDGPPVGAGGGYAVDLLLDDDASKDEFGRLLAPAPGTTPAALLFAAGHGIGLKEWEPQQAQQRALQGALQCDSVIKPHPYFAAGDLARIKPRLAGRIAFFFACFAAGTPRYDLYTEWQQSDPAPIAPGPFVAALPKALLSHRDGGMAAFVGHVDRAWGHSFLNQQAGPQLPVFRESLERILAGQPVGHAIQHHFGERYAMLSYAMIEPLKFVNAGLQIRDDRLTQFNALWTARNDAGAYAVLGDPAVRLRT